MAKSKIETIYTNTDLTWEQRATALYNALKRLMDGGTDGGVTIKGLVAMHDALGDEIAALDEIMDANGNDPNEHHAKSMVFYGRKLSARDVCVGVKNTTPSHTEKPFVGMFTGIDEFFREFDYGRIQITWDCDTGVSGVYKQGQAPSTTTLVQKHALGTKVVMPTIQNMDNDGSGTGTNTYKLKSGYVINGWKLATPNYYRYDDAGNDYMYIDVNGVKQKVKDTRIFSFGSSAFVLPYKNSIAIKTIAFQLDIISVWFNIEFIVRHGTPGEAAPCNVPIRTRLNNTVTLPLATLITMDAGYEIDTTSNPYGTWTTVDPNTGTSQTDPDGDPIPDREFAAGDSFLIGNDIDPGTRKLYLKIRTV